MKTKKCTRGRPCGTEGIFSQIFFKKEGQESRDDEAEIFENKDWNKIRSFLTSLSFDQKSKKLDLKFFFLQPKRFWDMAEESQKKSEENLPELNDPRDPSGAYLPLSTESLLSGAAENFDVFVKQGQGYFLLKSRKSQIPPQLIKNLITKHPYVYLRSSDRDLYFHGLETKLSKALSNPSLDLRVKASLITDLAVDLVDKIYSDPGNPRIVTQARDLSGYATSFLNQHRFAFLQLVALSSNDQYTYAHSVGVCAYSLALAKDLGYPDQKLVDIGLAGLLHDLGKSQIDPVIINKRGPLNPEEWAQMKKHPSIGGEILKKHKNLHPIVSLAAEAHHENLKGNGYPKGIVARELDPIVGIVSLADAFSALTTNRSYSKARDSMTALLLMKESLGTQFREELFTRFVTLFLDPSQQAA